MFASAIARADSRLHVHWLPLRHSNFSRILWYYRDLPSIAAQLDADIVHLTCPAPVRARAYKCPTVVSLHDLYPFDIPGNWGFLRSQISRRLARQCLTKIDAIACVSAFTESRLAAWFPAEVCRKGVTIPNSVEPLRGPALCAPKPFRAGETFVLCIAQHRENKNVPLAIKVFARALATHVLPRNSRLLVLGIPGPDTQLILNEVRNLDLRDNVVLLNGIADHELLWCYRNCAFLFAPSTIEGFGLPIVEALIAGCPVVCSDIPAFREVGRNRCRYVALNENSTDEFLRAFQDALAQPRSSGISIPELMPASIGGKYMELYRQLNGFPAVSQNGMLRHPDSKTRKVEAPVI
jgi:glycosyltransferase involved in cell wall biosynthesis